MGFDFHITKKDIATHARVGVITTPHGQIKTPAFVPVGTQAAVKSLSPDELHTLDVQLFFVNTYHAYLRPGLSVIHTFGGLHKFMGWQGPIITDSGGFQVFSLARPKYLPTEKDERQPSLVTIREEGVEFRSHWDGSLHYFTPESSMKWQWELGSDIHITFDDCTAYPVTHQVAKASMERTHRWAERSVAAHQMLAKRYAMKKKPYQALYGVIQGSIYKDLRETSAQFIRALPTDGIAIGGVSVGETKQEMAEVLSYVLPHLPEEKPRHLLGVGEVDDIFTLVSMGMDTFDCVQPTRLARMGRLYVQTAHNHEIDITKKTWEKDTTPVEDGCTCYTCTNISKAYLHHLFRVRELLAYRLATIHNLHFIHTLVAHIREAIAEGTLLEMKKSTGYNK